MVYNRIPPSDEAMSELHSGFSYEKYFAFDFSRP